MHACMALDISPILSQCLLDAPISRSPASVTASPFLTLTHNQSKTSEYVIPQARSRPPAAVGPADAHATVTKRQQGANIPWFTGLTGYDRRGTDNPALQRESAKQRFLPGPDQRARGPGGPGARRPGASARPDRAQKSPSISSSALMV